MNRKCKNTSNDDLGLEVLVTLPTVPAEGLDDWDRSESQMPEAPTNSVPSPFKSKQEYRLCRAVVDHPLRPSSSYPKLAGISSKTAVPIRRELVARKFIREHKIAKGGRSRIAICLEALPAGKQAISEYEAQKEENTRD